eukprot:scaffold5852_cov68-Skeletonema_dohrnii-CCMP3373.AAC.4
MKGSLQLACDNQVFGQGIEELDLKIWKQVVVPMPPPSTSVNSLCLLEVESERRATTSVAYSLILILDRCYVNY